MNIILKQYVDVEVERLATNIVNRAIQEKISDKSYQDFLMINSEGNDTVEKVSYDTVKINLMKEEITKYVQDVLSHLDDGIMEEYFVSNRIRSGRFKNIKNGILCDISIGSIRNSTLFANVGPTIPMKLLFASQIQSDVDVQVKEYGINNILVEFYLIMNIKEQVTMPLTSERKEIVIRTPISIDIIKGDIPKYYGGLLK